jgi:activator of HSP90 ATPase
MRAPREGAAERQIPGAKMNNAKIHQGHSLATTRRQLILGAAAGFGSLALSRMNAWADVNLKEEISHSAEAIHHEVVFKASRKRVYDALTDTQQFDKVTKLSAAAQSGMALGSKATNISREAGGAFSLFGGYIVGRQLELAPSERIVQAWRAGSWDPGNYSIAKFELTEQGADTKLIFDHTGFSQGQAQHLAEGWKTNYWEPLAKFLG